MDLSELEQDALKEFFNMGLGMAADSLSKMVKKEILLSLPQLAVVSHREAVDLVNHKDEGKLVAVRQTFLGGALRDGIVNISRR
jgi:chemotaxis protein CheC